MTNAAPLRLYLIRHGETKWTKSGRHTSRTDLPLTSPGEREARELGGRLRSIVFTRILCSPQQRARRTCELAEPGQPTDKEPDLVEWSYGDYEGKTSSDILKVRPNWDLFRDGCPGGESPRQVAARADRLIVRLRSLVGNIALFSHGQFGAVLAMRWIGLPVADAEHFPLGTGSISILSYALHHPEVSVVTRWNAPSGPSFDIGVYERQGPSTDEKPMAISRWEGEGGEVPGVVELPVPQAEPVSLARSTGGPSNAAGSGVREGR